MAKKKKSKKHKVVKRLSKKKLTGINTVPKVKRVKKIEKVIFKRAEETKRQGGVQRVKVRVIGIGGGGGTIVGELAEVVPKADFWVANTDIQALKRAGKRCHTLILGQELTHGLGTGSDTRLGQLAAKQAAEKISKLFQGVDLCILIACLGGGTGTGAAPVFAQLAKEAGCLTLGIFTLPFRFEGDRKQITARQSLSRMSSDLSASVIFPNEKIFKIIDSRTGFQTSLSAVNSMLAGDLKNLIEVIWMPGLINIDFADLRTILAERGQRAFLASAAASGAGENRVETVCKELLSHPLNDYDPRGAKNILFNIASGENISIDEVNYISRAVFELNPRARIVFGVSQNSGLGKSIAVTLLAVGSPARDNESGATIKRRKKTRIRKAKTEVKPDLVQAPFNAAAGKESLGKSPKGQTKKEEKGQAEKEEPPIESFQKEAKKGKSGRRTRVPVKKVRRKKPATQRMTAEKKKSAVAKQEVVKRTEKINRQFQKRAVRPGLAAPQRKTALDIHKEMESVEQEHVAREKKWDIPAFLRRQT